MKISTEINYRNAKYQGPKTNTTFLPQGNGIILDQNMSLAVSKFSAGQATGPTMVFYHHAKYIYGQWLQGLPNGPNVFRSGDTIVFAFYDRGVIVGKFLVIFEMQNLAVTVQMTGSGCSIVSRKDNLTSQEQIRAIINQTKFPRAIPDEYYSLISFIKRSFPASPQIKFKFEEREKNMTYFFGYPQGLGIIFDADNFIETIGVLDKTGQPRGLGGKFSINSSSQGNFQTQDLVKYAKTGRPMQKVKQIFYRSQAKEITFQNDFLFTNFHKTMIYIENILKQKLISQVAQQQLEDSVRYTHQDFNDSLQYQPRVSIKHDGERLKRLREELARSIRPGADIIVSPKKEYRDYGGNLGKSAIKKSQFEDIPNVAISRPRITAGKSPVHRQASYPSIAINRQNLIDQNLLQDYQIGQIKYENLQQRRDRVLNDYRHLRTEFPMVIGEPLPPPPVLVGLRPLYDSPGRQLLADTDRQLAPLSSSRRTPVVPVLHQRPILTNYSPIKNLATKDPKPQHSPYRQNKFDSYKKIHLREEEPNPPASTKPHMTPARNPDRDNKQSEFQSTHTLKRDKSAKKYNYLQGLQS